MGEGEQIAKVGNKGEKTAGTREHKPIFKGNKGTRTPLGDPLQTAAILVLCKSNLREKLSGKMAAV